MANKINSVVYTGVTSRLKQRVYEHKTHSDPKSFTAKYKITKLVYFEYTGDVRVALEREKQIKSWNRKSKNNLINSINPNWEDLYPSISE